MTLHYFFSQHPDQPTPWGKVRKLVHRYIASHYGHFIAGALQLHDGLKIQYQELMGMQLAVGTEILEDSDHLLFASNKLFHRDIGPAYHLMHNANEFGEVISPCLESSLLFFTAYIFSI